MSSKLRPPRAPWAVLLVLLLLLAPAAPVGAQPAGFVLVDDVWLPYDVVFGDSAYDAPAWTNGVVPYVFGPTIHPSKRELMKEAMAVLEGIADIDFVPRTNQSNYIEILPNLNSTTVSSSALGMIGGTQQLFVGGAHWIQKFVLVHELFHAMGFIHEHQRPDRDTYVTINWNNVSNTLCNGSCSHNFQIHANAQTTSAYDFLSVMHYGPWNFNNGNGPTITANPGYTQFQNTMGMGGFITSGDAAGLVFRYGGSPGPGISTHNPLTLAAGGGDQLLNVYGSRFFDGGPAPSGAMRSVVLVNGIPRTTVYVDRTHLQVTVPASVLASAGSITVEVLNAGGLGGTSNQVSIPVVAGFAPGFWPGQTQGATMGSSLANLGDVDDDGIDDYLIGSPGHNAGAGRVYCVSGATGQEIWRLTGGAGYRVGESVASAGDLTGDGRAEAMFGAPGYDNARGRVYIMLGHSGAFYRYLFGTSQGEEFGYAVSSAGDVNGDGKPDQLVGSPGNLGGTARIFDGNGTNVLWSRSISGSGSRFGAAVGGGFGTGPDAPYVAIGAPRRSIGTQQNGYVGIWAPAAGLLVGNIFGQGSYDRIGTSVAVTSAGLATPGARVRIVAGAPQPFLLGTSGTGGPGYVEVHEVDSAGLLNLVATLNGDGNGDRFGASCSSAGDLDQDGSEDVLVGAPEPGSTFIGPAAGKGYARVFSGRDWKPLAEMRGDATGDRLGAAVAPGGDADQDGCEDLLAGAPGGDVGVSATGYVRTYRPIVPPSPRKVMLTEVHLDHLQGVEITNFDLQDVDLGGWRVRWQGPSSLDVSNPIPSSTVLAAGESLIVAEVQFCGLPGFPSCATYPEKPAGVPVLALLPTVPSLGNPASIALETAGGVVIDEVRLGTGGPGAGPAGGRFRGILAAGSAAQVERIRGLDSNSPSDWLVGGTRSFGLENRGSGGRGADPLPTPDVVVNELDDSPDLVELRNRGSVAVDLQDWYFMMKTGPVGSPKIMRPFATPTTVPAGGFLVLGDSIVQPSELPAGVTYVSLWPDSIPFGPQDNECALFDDRGRLVDLVRTTRTDSELVHNHPRAPSHWRDFLGAAPKVSLGAVSVARSAGSADTDTGADWRTVSTRTMGSPNLVFLAGVSAPGNDDPLDVRLNPGPDGTGLHIILNAGPGAAGHHWSVATSLQPTFGTGPLLGLGADALALYQVMSQTPPWFGVLDQQGSARVDFPAGTLPPGFHSENIFLLQDGNGALVALTKVLSLDS